MNVHEQALSFDCEGSRLVGILSTPADRAASGVGVGVGVVIVVGGPQYRAGSHRQFVLLARALAQAGYPCLRFDLRGMGDSEGAPQGFESATPDIAAAIDALLQALPALDRVVLWGLCDAASASLIYWDERRDPRVAGLCLANPWVRSATSLAATHVKHYYLQRLRSPEFWRKLMRGEVAKRAGSELLTNLRLTLRRTGAPRSSAHALPFQDRMCRAWQAFEGPLLLLLSGADYTAKEFLEVASGAPAWRNSLNKPRLTRLDLPEADHTFSTAAQKSAVEQATSHWLRRLIREGQVHSTEEVSTC